MSKMKHGMVFAVKEHLVSGQPITQLEAIVLFGVSSLTKTISDMRKEGWVIQSRRVPYAKAPIRLNGYASLTPPNSLPIIEVHLTEYWISR